MNKYINRVVFYKLVIFLCLSTWVLNKSFADDNKAVKEEGKAVINEMISHNSKYLDLIDEDYFKLNHMPRVTLLTCSDSRIEQEFFNTNSFTDFFVIRNVGNQILENKSSIEYGVRLMNTPVLMILGHCDCRGATIAINSEDPLLPRKDKASKSPLHVLKNLNDQVVIALDMFKDLIQEEKLAVVGAIYDFKGDFGHGKGKLVIINVNGEQNPAVLKESYYLKNIDNISIGYINNN